MNANAIPTRTNIAPARPLSASGCKNVNNANATPRLKIASPAMASPFAVFSMVSEMPISFNSINTIPIPIISIEAPKAPLSAYGIIIDANANAAVNINIDLPTSPSILIFSICSSSSFLVASLTAIKVAPSAIAIIGDAMAVIIKNGNARAIQPANTKIDLPTSPSFANAPKILSRALAFSSPPSSKLLIASITKPKPLPIGLSVGASNANASESIIENPPPLAFANSLKSGFLAEPDNSLIAINISSNFK